MPYTMTSESNVGRKIWQGRGAAAAEPIGDTAKALLEEARRTLGGESTSLTIQDARYLVERWEHSIATSEPFEFDRRVFGDDGRKRVIRSVLVPVTLETGAEPRWVGFNLDVTDREMLASERDAIRDLNSATLESAGLGSWSIDPHATDVDLSPSAAFLLGFGRQASVAIGAMVDAIAESDRHAFSHALAKSVDEPRVISVEVHTMTGRRVAMLIRGAADGGVYAAIRDLDDDLRRLTSSFEAAAHPVYVLDRQKKVRATNPQAGDSLVISAELEAMIDRVLETSEPAMDGASRDRVTAWTGGVVIERLGRAVREFEAPNFDGAKTTATLRDAGPFEYWLARLKPRDQARAALVWNTGLTTGEAFRLESELLDGGVVRIDAKPIDRRVSLSQRWMIDVRFEAAKPDPTLSPSAALEHIRLSLATLESTPKPLLEQAAARLTSAERKSLAQRLDEIGAIRRYVDRLRTWDELIGLKPRRESVDVRAMIESDEELRTYQPMISEITGPAVIGDREMIRLAVAELLENARKFSGGGLSIISTPARLSVRDCGRGFPREIESLSEPLVRGSEADRTEGDGLGLAIVQRIMQRHGGRMALSNSVDGAVVDLFFV